jgi:hypothetical protein
MGIRVPRLNPMYVILCARNGCSQLLTREWAGMPWLHAAEHILLSELACNVINRLLTREAVRLRRIIEACAVSVRNNMPLSHFPKELVNRIVNKRAEVVRNSQLYR